MLSHEFLVLLFSAITVHVMARIRKSREKVAFMVIPLLFKQRRCIEKYF
uniref:Uncharacterized protein n=1 Tax=Anguilla anguilla TaxID=7936 RepID=A0A0E9T7P1_ANGAN